MTSSTVAGPRAWMQGRLQAWWPPAAVVALVAVLAMAGPRMTAITATTNTGHWETPTPVLLLGAIVGMTYGLLAAGLVIVYRTSRIINFAHGNIGAFAAALFGLAVVRWSVPYWVALPLALATGAAVAALTDVLVVRRLRNAPRLMSIVATLGVGEFVVLLGFTLNSQAGTGNLYPQPPGMPDFMLGGLRVSPAFSGMLILSPILLALLGVFLKYTRFGIGIRTASENPEAARMAGIFASRMTSLSWALAGVVAAFTAILTQPTRGFTTADSFGPSLLLMALAAATIARMTSIPVAVVGGLALGLLEQLLNWNFARGGAVEIALFAVILLSLLVTRQRSGREEDKTSWATVQAIPQVPDELRSVWLVRRLPSIVGIAMLVLAAALPLAMSPSATIALTIIYAYAIVALSLGVVTGLSGQLTLGQFAFAAVGAVVSYHVSMRTGWFLLAFVYAGGAAAAMSLIVGLPALRIRGLMATVTTLAFALAVPATLGYSWLLGDGVNPGRPIILGRALNTSKEYYFVGLAVLALMVLLARNIRQSGLGRLLVAVRDNEDAARSFTVPATRIKLYAFMLAGFIAGVGGAMYGHALSFIGRQTFPVDASIQVAKIAVIGGISTLLGPVIGALFVLGLPTFVPLDSAGLAASSFGQLLIIMYLPRGLVQVVVPLRDRIVGLIGRRAGVDVERAWARRDGSAATDTGDESHLVDPVDLRGPTPDRPRTPSRVTGVPILEVDGLQRSFGGVHAVRDVSFSVTAGQIVGLIGPNGAGKTTTFELISGFTRPDAGRVQFAGQDITGLPPERRAQLGLVRSFQDAALFPTLTVEEAVMLACERVLPTGLAVSVAGIRTRERRREAHARSIVGFMGLTRYRSKPIMELSTGTRRIVELACMVALEPEILLLDEPSSGIAQRETEALGSLLRRIQTDFGMTLLVIEHDIPLVMGLSDRVIAMVDGRILADGPPQQVRTDPRVIEAYLGGSAAAIERSGPAAVATAVPGELTD